jgi:predicted nucleic acid-binding protein
VGGVGAVKAFLDTNIVMDFCAKRTPYFEDASQIIDMGFRKEITLIVSSLTFINIAYILRKVYPADLVMDKLAGLSNICILSPIDAEVILSGIRMHAPDFEDTVQYLSALRCNADIIITRDTIGFQSFPIQTISPSLFLQSWDTWK